METTLPMGPCPVRSKKVNLTRKNLGYVSSCVLKKNNDIAGIQRKKKIIDTSDIVYDEKSSTDDEEYNRNLLYTRSISNPGDSASKDTDQIKKCKWCNRIIYPPAIPYRECWCDVTCCGFSNAYARRMNRG